MSLLIAYLGIVTVLIIALNARYCGEFLGVMDDPAREAHKAHKMPTPLVGALMIITLALYILANQYLFEVSTKMTGISVCTILVGLLGLFDDKFQLSWQLRLLVISFIATLLVWWVPELRLDNLIWSFGKNVELGKFLGGALSVICIMTLVISFNMMDGFNGGVIAFSIVVLIVMALIADNSHRQALCLFIISALGIMLAYNLKGEFFLGDGGAYSLGLLVGSVALLSYNSGGIIPVYADTVFVWLALPTLDCLRVVITRRLSRKSSPFFASRDHLHHILISASGPKRTLFIYVITVSLYSSMTLFSDNYTLLVLVAEISTFGLFLIIAKRHHSLIDLNQSR